MCPAGTTPATYAYNLDRQLTQITRPDSQTIAFGYDTGGRASTVTVPGGQIGYGYDPTTGNLSSVTGPYASTDSLTFGYDGSLLTGVTWSGAVAGTLAATYDDDFRVTQTTVNGGSAVTFGYDEDGLLDQAGSLAIGRDAANGLIDSTTLGTVTTTRTYNGFGEFDEYAAQVSSSDVFRTTYTRDGVGRITQIVETVQGTTRVLDYGYDLAGRLEEVMTDSVVTATYTYDTNGNRLQVARPGGTETGTYDAQDRLLTYGTASYSYTLAGELLEKVDGPDTTSYAYDVLGNLTQVVLPSGPQIDYVVDAFGRRMGKKVDGALVQGLLYQDQLNPGVELDSLGQVVSRFVYATRSHVPSYMVKGGTTYRIVSDHLGSVRLVIDESTGTVAQRLDYDEFGRVLTDTNPGFQPFGFAGGIYDADTGLTRFGARDYDPEAGRWAAKDPILFNGGNPNLLTYTANDPVNAVDVDGRCPQCVAAILALWGAAEVGLTISDFVDFLGTLFDPCASSGDKLTSFGLAAAGVIGPGGGYGKGVSLWGNRGTLARHFRDHGADFGARSSSEYADLASEFLVDSQRRGLPTKIGPDGTIRVYDPGTNTFGAFNPDGTTKTFFKPTGGAGYFGRQPGTSIP